MTAEQWVNNRGHTHAPAAANAAGNIIASVRHPAANSQSNYDMRENCLIDEAEL